MECVNCHRKRGDLLVARCCACIDQCEYLSLLNEPWIAINTDLNAPIGYRQCVRCRRGCKLDWFKEDGLVCSCCRKNDKTVEPEIEQAIKDEASFRKQYSRNQRNRLVFYHCTVCDMQVRPNSKTGHFRTIGHRENEKFKFLKNTSK